MKEISGALNILLADMFVLYLKTKNFHWHISGPHFRDYHLLLDEQSAQIFATTDDVAERARKVGGTTLSSIGHIARLQRVLDNDADFVTPQDMLAELHDDTKQLVAHMRVTHGICEEHGDCATTSFLENWIDDAERRVWFLFEASGARAERRAAHPLSAVGRGEPERTPEEIRPQASGRDPEHRPDHVRWNEPCR